MAIFIDPWAEQNPDWLILQNGPVALYHSPVLLRKDILWFESEEYQVISMECDKWTSECRFHTDVENLLNFPSYYGKNLNAFNDCLSDLKVPDTGGLVLVLWNFSGFYKTDFLFAHHVLDILAINSRRFLLFGKRLIILLHSKNPDLQIEPVGACPVTWTREFLRTDRVDQEE